MAPGTEEKGICQAPTAGFENGAPGRPAHRVMQWRAPGWGQHVQTCLLYAVH
jgi:hypothetical protein